MLLQTLYDKVEIHRQKKIIYAKFLQPHTVLSTCRAAGGFRSDLDYIYNHQSCEPCAHSQRMSPAAYRNPQTYRKNICQEYELPDQRCATLGTAANMNNACIASRTFRDLTVSAVCTGGVEGNAGRAGDPASVVEVEDGFERLDPANAMPGPGTINTMLFISTPLTEGAMVRTIMTATEAKTAALQELAVNSRYSDSLATGTGTDQIAVAACSGSGARLTSAGKHSKLGELIGQVVSEAIKQTLARQNNMTPSGQCSAKIHLERFGINRKSMQETICWYLETDQAELLCNNFPAIERDPVTVAAVAAMVHLKDKITWGILPATCWTEVMGSFAAQVACAVSGSYEKLGEYRNFLAPPSSNTGNRDFLELVCKAIAIGFEDKWRNLDALQEETCADSKEHMAVAQD
ncbi:adenosylcobinamide amidohydrolase [Desulfogranum japonicum]|uniref:adenosylcobinamide amidohydrolase n=1 Tax=Desulfogranum japonicum TaxID=231447 RepID=UPI000416B0AD|nr:adenosylcobinamide amidohydrolase [Desulfogranum japonicum]